MLPSVGFPCNRLLGAKGPDSKETVPVKKKRREGGRERRGGGLGDRLKVQKRTSGVFLESKQLLQSSILMS